VSVAAPGAGASVNFSAGTTSNNLSQVSFKNTNGVSFGLDAGTITATVKTDYQTSGAYLTTAALSGDTSKYVQAWEITGNTAGTTSSAQGTKLYFSGGANVTLSGNSNTIVVSAAAGGGGGSVNFSAGTTSSNLGSVVFSNSNAVNFGLSGSTITASVTYVTTSYATAGSATNVYGVDSANSTGTVTRWALEDHRHAGIAAVGISTWGKGSSRCGSSKCGREADTASLNLCPVSTSGLKLPLSETSRTLPSLSTWRLIGMPRSLRPCSRRGTSRGTRPPGRPSHPWRCAELGAHTDRR